MVLGALIAGLVWLHGQFAFMPVAMPIHQEFGVPLDSESVGVACLTPNKNGCITLAEVGSMSFGDLCDDTRSREEIGTRHKKSRTCLVAALTWSSTKLFLGWKWHDCAGDQKIVQVRGGCTSIFDGKFRLEGVVYGVQGKLY